MELSELARISKLMKPIHDVEKVTRTINEFSKVLKNIEKNYGYPVPKHPEKTKIILNSLRELEKNSETKEAIYTIPYKDLSKLVTDSFEVTEITILELINTDRFRKKLLSKFDQIEISEKFQNRKKIIEEALELYKLKYFSGCLCLLYSQLEGIITDYLLSKNRIEEYTYNKKTCYKKYGQNAEHKKNRIGGLFDKIDLCKEINDNFFRLKEYRLDSDENMMLSDSRNQVIHGSNINNFDEKTCFTIFIWINSIIQSIHE